MYFIAILYVDPQSGEYSLFSNISNVSEHALGSYGTLTNINNAIISAISSAVNNFPYYISFTPQFTDGNFSYAVYKGYIFKNAGSQGMAAIVLSSGAEYVYGIYNNNSNTITWRNITKRNSIQSQTITATTTGGGGISLGNFTNYSSVDHTPLYAFVTTENADTYCVLTSTSSTKATWVAVKNANGGVVASTSVTVTLVWKYTES